MLNQCFCNSHCIVLNVIIFSFPLFTLRINMLIAFINHIHSYAILFVSLSLLFSGHFLIWNGALLSNTIDQINTKKSIWWKLRVCCVSISSYLLNCLNVACFMDAQLLFDAKTKCFCIKRQHNPYVCVVCALHCVSIYTYIVQSNKRFHTC